MELLDWRTLAHSFNYFTEDNMAKAQQSNTYTYIKRK